MTKLWQKFRMLPLVCVMLLCLACASVGMAVLSASADGDGASSAASAQKDYYEVDLANLTPEQLALDEKCNPTAGNKSISYNATTKTLDLVGEDANCNSGAGTYWGMLWDVPLDRAAYTDFTYEIVFKINVFETPAEHGNPFIGMMYRTKKLDNGGTNGYVHVYRQIEGQSTYSAFNWNGSAAAGNDQDVRYRIAQGNNQLYLEPNAPSSSGGEFHRYTIAMQGGKTAYYIDGFLIREIADYNAHGMHNHLKEDLTSGGFSLVIARRAEISIKSIRVKDTAEFTGEPLEKKEHDLGAGWREADGWEIIDNFSEWGENEFSGALESKSGNGATVSLVNGSELQITGPNNSWANYGGAYWQITPVGDDYEEFTFEMKFRRVSSVASDRYFTVWTHTNYADNGRIRAYGVNYRQDANGGGTVRSAQTMMWGTETGVDVYNVAPANAPSIYDTNYHTVTYTMIKNTTNDEHKYFQNYTILYYMDGVLVHEQVTSDNQYAQVARINGQMKSGGFGLTVNGSTMAISSVKISRTPLTKEDMAARDDLASVPYSAADFDAAGSYTAPEAYELNAADGDFATAVENGDFGYVSGCDVTGSNVSVDSESGELVVSSNKGSGNYPGNNPANTLYYGAFTNINAGAKYKDFTLNLQFKANSWKDAARWLGIVYHKKTVTTATTSSVSSTDLGYLVNYRVNGQTAYSAINSSRAFLDTDVVNSGTAVNGYTMPMLSDGNYHTLTVTVEGNTAKHYMDGILIRTVSNSDKNGHLGYRFDIGEMGLIVASMEISIKSLSVVPEVVPPRTVGEIDNTLVSTYTDGNIKMTNAPTVVADVRNILQLNNLTKGTHKPTNAVLRFKKIADEYFVVDAKGNKLREFGEVYSELKHGIIPVLYVENETDAAAVAEYLKYELRILDIAVMSPSPEAIKIVKSELSSVRGILVRSEEDFYEGDKLAIFDNVVAVANECGATTVAIPQSIATVENVRFIQARFHTAWVIADSASDMDLHDSVNSGAYGVITTDFGNLYSVLESYPASTSDASTLARMPFNVAHRGKFSNTSEGPYENSLQAVRDAIACGATHLELDGYLTSDGKIVIMHDETIDRTTNGSGKISEMTLAEIRSYKLLDGQDIPTLEEVFEILEDTQSDIVLVLELKSGNQLAPTIKNMIGTSDGKYDVLENLVIISFSESLLSSVKSELPSTATSFLKFNVESNTLATNLREMGMYNTTLDANYTQSEFKASYEKKLSDRGVIGWYWTFDSGSDLISAAKAGYVGLTNNSPAAIADYAVKVEGATDVVRTALAVGDTVPLKVTAFNGEVTDADGVVAYVETVKSGWRVVASYTADQITHHTVSFEVAKPVKLDAPKLKADVSASKITWAKVEGASGYAVTVTKDNSVVKTENISANEYSMSAFTDSGSYTVTVKAVSELSRYIDSDSKSTTYTVAAQSDGGDAGEESGGGCGSFAYAELCVIGLVLMFAAVALLAFGKKRA